MNTFELKIWDDECKRCTFYTVQLDNSELSETDKFFERYENDPKYSEAIKELLSFILYSIGDDHGAVDALFNRYENEVFGLPSRGNVKIGVFSYHFPNFPLRLYALKITDEIVVLFNGGIKDGATNQSSSVNIKWVEACRFAKIINEALQDGLIQVMEEERKLVSYDNGYEIVLYK